MEYNPFIATQKRTTPEEHYCSCLVKQVANSYRYNRSTNPYAICSSSVFNRRGLKGPGPVSCSYTYDYLESLPYSVLYNYALAKGQIREGDAGPEYNLPRNEIVEILADFFESEGKLVDGKSYQYKQQPQQYQYKQQPPQKQTYQYKQQPKQYQYKQQPKSRDVRSVFESLKTDEEKLEFLQKNRLLYVNVILTFDSLEQDIYDQFIPYTNNVYDFLTSIFDQLEKFELEELNKISTHVYYIEPELYPKFLMDTNGKFFFKGNDNKMLSRFKDNYTRKLI